MKRRTLLALAGTGLAAGAGALSWRNMRGESSIWAKGDVIGGLDGVDVYNNGPVFVASHGRHYAQDGYYFGQKWQCVEFVKRYLYQARGHRLPDGMGHAISFFDPATPHGEINAARGMRQFMQGGREIPRAGDLMVFGGAGGYGHVAIVAQSSNDFVTITQQNKAPVQETFRLLPNDTGGIEVAESWLPPLGWLRVV